MMIDVLETKSKLVKAYFNCNNIWKYSELPFLKTFLMKKLPIKVIETCCNECEYKSKDSGD